jgi:hypothetical protein
MILVRLVLKEVQRRLGTCCYLIKKGEGGKGQYRDTKGAGISFENMANLIQKN